MEPLHCPGYQVSSKLKAKFCDLRSAFMKAYTNFQKSGQGENGNGVGHDIEDEDGKKGADDHVKEV